MKGIAMCHQGCERENRDGVCRSMGRLGSKCPYESEHPCDGVVWDEKNIDSNYVLTRKKMFEIYNKYNGD